MLTIKTIRDKIPQLAIKYQVAKVDIFGSYASGYATEDSDVDFLVTFIATPPSIFTVMGFREELAQQLNTPVDVVTLLLPRPDKLKIDKVVNVYERP
jgi:predicted nucleotidyltransferase